MDIKILLNNGPQLFKKSCFLVVSFKTQLTWPPTCSWLKKKSFHAFYWTFVVLPEDLVQVHPLLSSPHKFQWESLVFVCWLPLPIILSLIFSNLSHSAMYCCYYIHRKTTFSLCMWDQTLICHFSGYSIFLLLGLNASFIQSTSLQLKDRKIKLTWESLCALNGIHTHIRPNSTPIFSFYLSNKGEKLFEILLGIHINEQDS